MHRAVLLGTLALACQPIDLLAGPAALFLLVWLPGQLLVRIAGIENHWTPAPRNLLAVALSLTIVPVLLNPLWHFSNRGPTLMLGIAIVLGIVQEIAHARPRVSRQRQRLFNTPLEGLTFVALLALVTFATIGTYWPASLGGGPVPAQIHDFIKHHAVLFSLAERPLPLGNPFFAPHADGPVYYYHFFYLIPATLRAVAPSLSIQFAFGLHAALVGCATVGAFALLARLVYGGSPPALFAAALATVIGGLDLLPLLIQGKLVITLDAWADPLVRIHNLLTQFVWTPQNMQGLLILLVAALLLGTCRRTGTLALLLGLLAAGLIGSTVWVAAAVLPAAALLTVLALRDERGPHRWVLPAVGIVAMLACATPSIVGYLRTSAVLGKSLTLAWPHQQNAVLGQFLPAGILANLVDLPWVLLIEFGALAILPLLLPAGVWAIVLRHPGGRLVTAAGFVGLLAFVTVRSHFTYNDFGQKVILATQAAGVLLAAGVLERSGGPGRWWNPFGLRLRRGLRFGGVSIVLIGFVCLAGLPVGLFQTPLATVRRMLPAAGPLKRLVPDDALRARREADLLRAVRDLPPDAVIQPHWTAARLDILQMTGRQVGVTELERDTMVFQSDRREIRDAAVAQLAGVLETAAPPERLHAQLRELRITHVIVGEVERVAWLELDRFRDGRYFETAWEAASGGIYVVRPGPGGDGPASRE